MKMSLYLAPTEYIDYEDEAIRDLAAELKRQSAGTVDLIKKTYEYVRDHILHAYDTEFHTPAARASEVLRAGGSICWGKANLLAALLRANGIPSGISYQLLTKGDTPDTGYIIHALNTAYVDDVHKWVRMDARGNKEGVDAQFSLDEEKLAFPIRSEFNEWDFRDNHPDADPDLMESILQSDDILDASSDTVIARRLDQIPVDWTRYLVHGPKWTTYQVPGPRHTGP